MALGGDPAAISWMFALGKKMAGAPKSWGDAPTYSVQAMPGISLMWQAEGASSSLSVCPRTPLLMSSTTYEYTIDGDDVIRHVNDAWKDFALENHGQVLADGVVGSWLWQHLAGREVKPLYRALVERVRDRQVRIEVPFRCDAPDLRRHMALELIPLPASAVRFSCRVVTEEPLAPVKVLDPSLESDPHRMIRMCAWCKRIEGGAGDWLELEEALSDLELFQMETVPGITHGVCPECQSVVLRGLGGAD